MEIITTNIIPALLVLIVGLWLKTFLSNFLNEKGKNLAQKQDIAEITRNIENVKADFSNRTEVLKSDLQRLLNLQLSHRNEERNSIVGFYDKFNQWLYALLEINFGAYNRSNIKDLIDKRIYIERFYGDANIAQSKLKLLVKDNEIIKLGGELMIELLNFKGWMDLRLLQLQHKFESHNFLYEGFSEMLKDYENNKDAARQAAADEQKLKLEIEEFVKSFYANRNAEYFKILPIDDMFREKVKKYLTE